MTPAPHIVGSGGAGQCLAAALLATAAECDVHDVWAWNFEAEFTNLIAACSATNVILAFDVEFPGFIIQEPRTGPRAARYRALRENVDSMRPIQFGVAVANLDGKLLGVWSFNLQFNEGTDTHAPESVEFLRAAGIDFPRHAAEGIEASTLGVKLGNSELIGNHVRAPCWVTFSGFYDFGYLLQMLTSEKLPQSYAGFDARLSQLFPRRYELRDQFPHGSLDCLAQKQGLLRRGLAHTAGSDALLTLDLFFIVRDGRSAELLGRSPSDTNSTGWSSTCSLEAISPSTQSTQSTWTVEDTWDMNSLHWYQAASLGWNWEVERWASNPWEFSSTPVLAAPTLPLQPR
eukprot:CAMPEP_0206619832 /NCGR_PEP_ID=MMETSP0325_2-20121206/61124_1 /ASSEMBLY_ACC=CAM_ASM_000347 /TAXON_ID=2866 /ORGANISM="Crypthecodinium cohnii, Strain Seligo" /LENGTH=344 /DNA_ID=CAMNT_0054142399 /DNA_START=8 /DNA_END=1042 /DNA_ORIENTATION=+